ncbi:MAG: pilus assembly protein PilZ [Treponema sp.]|nr:pilus assembly protein PilZ [Treponema sp.]
MGVLPAKKIATYYNVYKEVEATFTKNLIDGTGLVPDQVQLKCGNEFWSCALFATSFLAAKVVMSMSQENVIKLRQANGSVSLRLCFRNTDERGGPITFFIAGRVVNLSPYNESKDTALVSVQFTQRPPDDFIEIIGRLLDAIESSAKRKDERILVTPESQRKLKMLSREAVVFIQKVPRRCIVRDVAFSSAKVVLMGVSKFLLEKDATLRLDFDYPMESFMLPGKFVRGEAVQGKPGMVALAMVFDDERVPLGYKARINEHISTLWANNRSGQAV